MRLDGGRSMGMDDKTSGMMKSLIDGLVQGQPDQSETGMGSVELFVGLFDDKMLHNSPAR